MTEVHTQLSHFNRVNIGAGTVQFLRYSFLFFIFQIHYVVKRHSLPIMLPEGSITQMLELNAKNTMQYYRKSLKGNICNLSTLQIYSGPLQSFWAISLTTFGGTVAIKAIVPA